MSQLGITPISEHETFGVYDSSKVQTFMRCPRHFFFAYILGWRKEEPNIHLGFGSAWHDAMEHLYKAGLDNQNVLVACALFERRYLQEMGEYAGNFNAPGKSLEAGWRALEEYARLYRAIDEGNTTLYTEVAGAVPITTEGRTFYTKMDTILRDKFGRIWSHEHKTTGRRTAAWENGWSMKLQINAYIYALRVLFPDDDVAGVKINGAILYKDRAEFLRIPVEKNDNQLLAFLWQANYFIDDIERNMEALADTSEADAVLQAFPANPEACGTFGCPYNGFCETWTNPLRHCQTPPIGFREEFWDPRKREDVNAIIVPDASGNLHVEPR